MGLSLGQVDGPLPLFQPEGPEMAESQAVQNDFLGLKYPAQSSVDFATDSLISRVVLGGDSFKPNIKTESSKRK